jgi:hypothetical protein
MIDGHSSRIAPRRHVAHTELYLTGEAVMRRTLLAPFILLLTSVGCVIAVDPSCSTPSAAIVVTPAVVIVAVGQSFTPSATEHGCDGRYHDHSSPHWSLANQADSMYVRVNATTGEITGRRSGYANVVARSSTSDGEGTIGVTVR